MKKRICGVGACVFDTLFTMDKYPEEDTKTAAVSRRAGGGPTATGLVAAQKLGDDCAYIGQLTDDAGGEFLLKDFRRWGINTEYITCLPGYRTFSSVIWLAKENASRTCVFDRGDMPVLKLNDAQKQAVRDSDLLMADGNNLPAALEAADIARENGVPVLYDCGGRYPEVEKLLAKTDYIIPSEEFALGITGCGSVPEAARVLWETYRPSAVVITMGKKGGYYRTADGEDYYPAFPVEAVDTNGSGDVFHGAFAHALLQNRSVRDCCLFASATSALKCLGLGARESVPEEEAVLRKLRTEGFDF